jgi:hypothetical protein
MPCIRAGQECLLCHIFSSGSLNEVVRRRTGRAAPVRYLEADHESQAQTRHFVLLVDSMKNDG